MNFDGFGCRAGVVVSRFNEDITDGLLQSAREALKKFNVQDGGIAVVSVAGAVETPVALQKLADTKNFDFLVVLGAVIRGETPHFDYVCKMAQEGALRVMLDYHIPVGFGIITVNNIEQAKARLHVGGEAVAAALELALIKVDGALMGNQNS